MRMRQGGKAERPRAAGLLVTACLLAAAGCGGPPLEFAEVRGKVTLNGAPLYGVVVTFYPDGVGKDSPPYARGTTDDAGQYKLSTQEGKPGAVVGKHRVVVNWPPRERTDAGADKPPPRPAGPSIPVKYTVASDTPLIFEVKAGSAQTIDLPLKN
jgi:hypothetical protein